jgi:integrase
MRLCAGRVAFVLDGPLLECGGCGRPRPPRAFWVEIERVRVDAPHATDQVDAAALVHRWAADLRARACRPKSVSVMTSTVLSFSRRVAPTPLLSVTRDELVAYLGTEGWSPLTRRTYRTTLASFYDWATQTGLTIANPAGRLPRTRVPYSEPNPLSTAQINRLLRSGIRRRTQMMVLLAAYQGLRAAEIAHVHGRDVTDHTLHVPEGKGGTSLRRPLHPVVHAASAGFPRDDYWFPGNGRPHVDGRSVSATISQAMRRAGIEGHRPHQLRAWHATELIRSGVDAVTVQHSMRHATLGTLHKYVHPDAADVLGAISLLPPLTPVGLVSAGHEGTPEDRSDSAP